MLFLAAVCGIEKEYVAVLPVNNRHRKNSTSNWHGGKPGEEGRREEAFRRHVYAWNAGIYPIGARGAG